MWILDEGRYSGELGSSQQHGHFLNWRNGEFSQFSHRPSQDDHRLKIFRNT